MLSTPTTDADRLASNLAGIRTRIANAVAKAGRSPGVVTLVAVTKRSPADWVRTLVGLGATDLGENYPQELWSKVEALADLPVRWHHIGHLQGNKAKRTLPLVRMVHGVDSLKLLLTIDGLVGIDDPPGVCLQVNVSGEATKHGWTADALLDDAEAIAGVRRVPVVGLMTIAGLGTGGDSARPAFARLREIRDRLATAIGRSLPCLSMGMTADFEAAILEGATHVRIGSALFEGVGP